MKTLKKVLAVLLCFSMLAGVFATNASANLTDKIVETHDSRREFGDKINDIIQAVLKGICVIYPAPRSWKWLDDYTGENVYDKDDGRADYLASAADGAQWKLGYASGSIIPEDFEKNKYYLGRQLNVVASADIAKADGILDDQRVRVICVDDNSGEGAVVFAVIDGLGVTSKTIRDIRAEVTRRAKENRWKISAVNVSATHCHSALDTQGVSTSFLYVLFANNFTNILGTKRAATSNDAFIENIINVTSTKIGEAYNGMEKGKIFYETADVSDHVRDKRGYVAKEDVPDVGILRFEPDNIASKGTYFVNMTCHPTTVSARAGLVSGDYPYYFDKAIQKAGYNFIMAQGAVGQVSSFDDDNALLDKYADVIDGYKNEYLGKNIDEETLKDSDYYWSAAVGNYFADKVLAAKSDNVSLKPVLNAKYEYIQFTAENYCLHLACKIRLVDNEVYRTGFGLDDMVLPSEVGYVEFGNRVAFGLYPCELYPEVFHGQEIVTNDKEGYAWNGESWNIKSGKAMVKAKNSNIDTYAICFANDYIGYVVPDNFYSGWGHWALKHSDEAYGELEYEKGASLFDYAFRGTADELLSAGKNKASSIMNTFEKLVNKTVVGLPG